MVRWGLVFLWLGVCQPGSAQAAEATAAFDRTTIYEGESVTLVIKVASSVDNEIDLEPLAEDFEIVTTGQSSRMQNINGRRFVSTQWDVTLEPLRAGTINVPPLSVGRHMTAPVSIEVLEREVVTDASQAQDMFLEVSVEPRDPYVQSQVLYTLRLHHTLPITEGSLGEPDLPFAVVERIPNDINYRTERNGRRYTVIERRYAIFPERSGKAQIPSIRFVGRVQDSRSGGQFNRMFDRGRRVTLRSDAVELNVRPKPASFSGTTWLPARSLTLHDPWKNDLPEFHMGEPITRTLILQGQGLLETQLPELQTAGMAGFRTYPDQPVSESRKDTPWITAYREEKRAIVPERAGTLVLPEVALPWWDTQADQERIALIPAMTVQVLPAEESGAASPETRDLAEAESTTKSPAQSLRPSGGLLWQALALTATAAWILTLLAWLRDRKRRASDAKVKPENPEPTIRAARKATMAACKSNNAADAAQGLITWCDLLRPDVHCRTLRQVAAQLSDEPLCDQIVRLDRALYAGEAEAPWRGEELLRCLKRGLPLKAQGSNQTDQTGPLPALYS